jgi:hypothetical protein
VQVAAPTMATAGAQACTIGDAVLLGPHGGAHAVLAFDRTGGLAAWKREKAVLALQPVALDGKKLGPQSNVVVREDIEPLWIYALGTSFVVLLRKWDWQSKELNWWGVVVDRTGRAVKPPAEIGLADMDIGEGEVLDQRRIRLHVGPGYASKNQNSPARWQTLTITRTGLASSVIAADQADLVVAAEPGAVAFHVTNRAVPPGGRGPGGMVIEAMGRPVLERTHAGTKVGEALDIMWHGNPIAHGMNIESYIVWSGTHFLYPFYADDGGPTHDKYAESLLPIDCRPN